jgi:protease-4
VTALTVLCAVFVIGAIAGVLMLGVIGFWAGAGVDQFIIEQPYRDAGGRRIAVIPVRGVIDGRRAEFVRLSVQHVLDDPSFDAVVLRVDSPGGGVTASDQIWHHVTRMKDQGLPVVASFGSVAASGGYYVSCDADEIVAERTSITGSIGVIAQILTFQGLMDKVGVEPVTLVASDSPDKEVANNVFREWNERDREQVRELLNAAYDTFYQRVRDGRKNAIADDRRLDQLADGSVFTAEEALEAGLVDTMGYLDDAILSAEKRAGITAGRASVVVLTERPMLFGQMPLAGLAKQEQRDPLDAETIRTFANELGSLKLMYLMW